MTRNPYEGLPAVAKFSLASDAIAGGTPMPMAQVSDIFGAGGSDTSPDLSWSGFPAATRSFFVSMYDPDAPTPAGFWHWMAVNIPGDVTSLNAGAGDDDDALPGAAIHLANDAGLRRYVGAGPPPGDPPHHYYVAVTALDIEDAGLTGAESPALASFQAREHMIARAMLVPIFGR
jgi:Raf kinase inhibitor-like YbhB/YbcL family protein